VTNEQPLTINPVELLEVQQALPYSPTCNNWESKDRGVLILHYEKHPAHEVPHYASKYHVLPIWGRQSQADIEAGLDNRPYRGRFGNGANGIIPAECSHWATWDRDISLTVLFLHPGLIEQVVEVKKGRAGNLIPKHDTGDPTLSQLGLLLKADLEAECPSGQIYRDSLATALAARLVSHHSICTIEPQVQGNGLSSQRLETLVNYVDEYLDQEIRLINLAKLVDLSEYYLCRSFKQAMGISLHQYIMQQRLERTKRLLLNPDLSIAQIAQLCGFSSHSHLTSQFKRCFGVSPKLWRSLV
jgi:AraC family transcriptional regulator